MLWLSRALVFLLGFAAWVVSFTLAAVGMGSNAPPWLIPGIALFAVIYIVGGAVSLPAEYRASKQQERRELENDALALARDIGASYEKGFGMNMDLVVENYRHHFADRAKKIAKRFRSQKVPQTDVFFDFAENGATDFTGVFNVKEGADRLARQLNS